MFHLYLSLFFFSVQRQVVLGLALLLFPSGFHPRATQWLFTSLLRTCPIQHNLSLLTSSLIGSTPAISSTSLFGSCCCYLMQKILLRHLVWKMSSFFTSPFVISHVSQPQRSTGSNNILKRTNLMCLSTEPDVSCTPDFDEPVEACIRQCCPLLDVQCSSSVLSHLCLR